MASPSPAHEHRALRGERGTAVGFYRCIHEQLAALVGADSERELAMSWACQRGIHLAGNPGSRFHVATVAVSCADASVVVRPAFIRYMAAVR